VQRLISVRLFLRAARPRLRPRAAVVLPAVVALTLAAALSGCRASASGAAATSDTVPPYYAETIAIQPPAYDSPLNVSIRDTTTGQETAALRALPPYQSIGFVVATGKPNWWIAGAQLWHPVNYDNSAQPAKLYLATMEATEEDGNPLNQYMLTPLPVTPMLATQLIDGTAASSGVQQLAAATASPDGKRLALVITRGDTYQVSVYPVTGAAAVRTWSGEVSPTVQPFAWGFSLTWLSDDKTLAVGIAQFAGGSEPYRHHILPGAEGEDRHARRLLRGSGRDQRRTASALPGGRHLPRERRRRDRGGAVGVLRPDRRADRGLEQAHDLLRADWHRIPPHPVGQPARHARHRERNEHG
jgi:hypothetical protein